jgi:hypothetical protein
MQYEHEGAEQTFARFYANAFSMLLIIQNRHCFWNLEKKRKSIPN